MRLFDFRLLVHVCVLGAAVGLGAPAAAAALTAGTPAGPAAPQTKTTAKKTPAKQTSSSASRKARLARARAAAKAREQARLRRLRAEQEAMTPRFKADENGDLVPDVRAAAAIIFDPQTGQVLWQENAQDQRPIASITKVMTALVFLEDGPDLSQVVTVQRSDVYAASTTFLRASERVSVDNLLHLALIASDNAAARVLARISHGGTAAFVERMNEKALELGLESTKFADPSGLNPENMSSAYDLSRLISLASADERIASMMRMAEYKVSTSRRTFTIRNTNHLLRNGEVDVMAGKTGFIRQAGYCLATLLRLPHTNHQIAVVVLGATSNQGRFWETRHLVNWFSQKAADLFTKAQQQ